MKNKKCGKRNRTKSVKCSSEAGIHPESENSNYNTNLEYFMSESEKLKDMEILIDKFLKDAMENYFINEFEAGDIRFMLNDYLSSYHNQLIPDFYMPCEDETNNDLI